APAGAPARAAKPTATPGSGFPWAKRISDASRYARGRVGTVSFAVVDERGRIRGFHRGTRYSSASLVKAMLLVAYLRGVRGRELNAEERGLLGPMIRVSDNDAADAIYAQVGPSGLQRLARRSGMRRFAANPAWGGCQVTAVDQARFFRRLGSLLPPRHRKYGLGLLSGIVASQRWGIPQGAPKGWRLHFKGGWYPGDPGGWRVHQAALLRRGGRRLGVAVLTSGDPSYDYGATTIRGVTARLLRGYRAATSTQK
ncbi:MAG: serine hydrolase, partial [Solirubrobacterales bacterium]